MMAALAASAMTLGELLGSAAGSHAGLEIKDLVLDSRQVTPGAAFLAVPGGRTHGIEYAREAIARGAVVVVYEPPAAKAADVPEPSVPVADLHARLGTLAQTFFGRDREPSELCAVTGTNGKTTVAYLVAQALGALGHECGYIGTLGYGVPPTLEPHGLTTPDCLTLHRELAQLATPYAALEVSSHALGQERLAGLRVRTAALTNLSRDHLDYHGDFAGYAAAKETLFTRPELEYAVLNLDDAFGRTLAARAGLAPQVLGVSLVGTAGATLVGRLAKADFDGLVLEIGGIYGDAVLRSPLVGDFNAENLLIALGVLLAVETPLEAACEALGGASGAPGRMERIGGPRQGAPRVIVDYAHTPDGLARVLSSLRAYLPADAAIWCVFGCGGGRDQGKRQLMGEIASRGAEHLIVTDDNPRAEDPQAITDAILAGVGAHPDARVVHERGAAIRTALEAAAPADLVLIAGKGHETTQLIAGATRPFSDREVARTLLRGRS